jgi:hypothetical protein
MYEEYLGKGYHDKVRKMLTVDDKLLPDSIIDAQTNIGAMKMLLAPTLEKMQMLGKTVDTEEKYNHLASAGLYYLCGVLCMAMKSRTSAPPFNIKKYQKRWDKKRDKYMQKGNELLLGLMRMG